MLLGVAPRVGAGKAICLGVELEESREDRENGWETSCRRDSESGWDVGASIYAGCSKQWQRSSSDITLSTCELCG